MPTYNRAALIRETIASITGQTFSDFELILIDDGSNDNTESVVRQFRDNRIKYIRIPHSGRPSVPRNVGLDVASGRYVAFMDSDDLWHPSKLEKQMRVFVNNPKVDISFTNGINFSESSMGPSLVTAKLFRWCPFKYALLWRNFIPTLTVMAKNSFIKEHHLRFNPSRMWVDDYEFWLRAALSGASFHFLNEELAQHRIHQDQITVTSVGKKDVFDMLKSIDSKNLAFSILKYLAIIKLNYRDRSSVE
jgi:glycosyltransferase involved in cell wall biosynthesis